MSHNLTDSLLEPSIKHSGSQKPMFSITSHFLVAFFGGPIGLTLFSMISIFRIGKLRENIITYILLSVISIGFTAFVFYLYLTGWPNWLMIMESEASSLKNVIKIFSVILCGAIYLLHKHYFSISRLSGEKGNPWVAGITCVITGMLVYALMIFIVGVPSNG